jgi:hypothetical protein
MKNNKIYICGGGTSLKDFRFDKLKNKETIVVNKSIFSVPNANCFITCDNTFLWKLNEEQKLQFRNMPIPKYFVIQLGLDYLKEKNNRIVDIRSNIVYNLDYYDNIIKSYKLEGFGLEVTDFRSGVDSAYCALQLSIILGYKEIYLLGIDFIITDKTHFHEGYKQSLTQFAKRLNWYYTYWEKGLKELKEKQPDINVYNCSKISKLNNLIPYKEI